MNISTVFENFTSRTVGYKELTEDERAVKCILHHAMAMMIANPFATEYQIDLEHKGAFEYLIDGMPDDCRVVLNKEVIRLVCEHGIGAVERECGTWTFEWNRWL